MHSRNRWTVLAVVCASVYLINLDITIVNAALPTLVRELHAGTRDLQWIVDAYNLTFAAFVLAAGSLSDRYGRRGALIAGLAIFGTATAAGATAGTTAGRPPRPGPVARRHRHARLHHHRGPRPLLGRPRHPRRVRPRCRPVAGLHRLGASPGRADDRRAAVPESALLRRVRGGHGGLV